MSHEWILRCNLNEYRYKTICGTKLKKKTYFYIHVSSRADHARLKKKRNIFMGSKLRDTILNEQVLYQRDSLPWAIVK